MFNTSIAFLKLSGGKITTHVEDKKGLTQHGVELSNNFNKVWAKDNHNSISIIKRYKKV